MKFNKNLGIATLVLFATLSCNDEKKQEQQPGNPTPNEVKAPDQIVSIEEAKNMYNNYTKKRADLIEATEAPQEDGSKFIASRYGDYDIETIKNYIKYVEQQADSAGVKVETLRFYFSTYPDKKDFPNNKKIKHPRQNSFFIVPTMKVDTMNLGFYIKNLGDGKKEAALIRDYSYMTDDKMGEAKKHNKSYASIIPNFTLSSSQSNESLILNKGNMGPPPHNPDF